MDRGVMIPIEIFICFSAIVILYNSYLSKKRLNNQKREIEKNFGKKHTNKVKVKESELYDILGGDVDDTTFNDLNLMEYIKKFNHTVSTPGIQAFYLKLRNLRKNRESIEKIINRRKFLLENENICKRIQLKLLNIGNFNDSVLEFMSEKVEIDSKLKTLTYIFSFTIIYIIAGFLLFKKNFIFFAILLFIINVYLYRYFNKMTYGSLNGLMNLGKVLKFSKDFEKENFEVFNEEIDELKALNLKLDPLYKGALGLDFRTGSIELDFVAMYLNIIFLVEARKFIKSHKYIEKYKDEIYRVYEIVGSIDAEVANVSIFKAENLTDAEFVDEGINGINLKSPFIEDAVANNFVINNNSVLLTGSNASGKSTYLRTVGINMLLSHTYGYSFSESLKTEYIRLKSSIDISDSIFENVSYFMAEASEIKKMIDNKEKELILLDEIFKGTNTIDRISAATATLKYLSSNNYVIAATHDIELTDNLKDYYRNYHFEEKIVDGDIKFDYKLKDGPATSRNAIEILKSLDYPEIVIEESREMAKELEIKKEPAK